MSVMQLIYVSQPFGFEDSILAGILTTARRNNPRDGITGCLVCRHDLYLQLLEGNQEPVEALYRKIAIDDRHLEVKRLVGATVADRIFPQWAMRDDPARSWLWSTDEVGRGAAEAASADELRAIFIRIAAEDA